MLLSVKQLGLTCLTQGRFISKIRPSWQGSKLNTAQLQETLFKAEDIYIWHGTAFAFATGLPFNWSPNPVSFQQQCHASHSGSRWSVLPSYRRHIYSNMISPTILWLSNSHPVLCSSNSAAPGILSSILWTSWIEEFSHWRQIFKVDYQTNQL